MTWKLTLGNTDLGSAPTFEQAMKKAFSYLNRWHFANAGKTGNTKVYDDATRAFAHLAGTMHLRRKERPRSNIFYQIGENSFSVKRKLDKR